MSQVPRGENGVSAPGREPLHTQDSRRRRRGLMLPSPLPGGPLSQGLAVGSDGSDGREVSLLADHKQQTNARPK